LVICKFCSSKRVVKKGKVLGKQFYECKSCNHRFVDNGSFVKMRVESRIIAHALDLYYEGLSVRKVSRQIEHIFGFKVSQVTIWKWIVKYSKLVSEFLSTLKPELSGDWHVDETVIKAKGEQKWFWEVIDKETRYLVSSHLSGERTIEEVVKLFTECMKSSKERPKKIVTDGLWAYEKGFNKVFYSRYKEKRVEHIKNAGIRSRLTNNLVERLHGTIKDRTKPARGLKATAKTVLDGWVIHYNFVRPHGYLKGKTPAEASGIPTKGWHELIQQAIVHNVKKEKKPLQQTIPIEVKVRV